MENSIEFDSGVLVHKVVYKGTTYFRVDDSEIGCLWFYEGMVDPEDLVESGDLWDELEDYYCLGPD